MLVRYWFKSREGRGIGVTAYDLSDAIAQVQDIPYLVSLDPDFSAYTENVDVQTLDQDHVTPNMGLCSRRGVWYPNVEG